VSVYLGGAAERRECVTTEPDRLLHIHAVLDTANAYPSGERAATGNGTDSFDAFGVTWLEELPRPPGFGKSIHRPKPMVLTSSVCRALGRRKSRHNRLQLVP